jgi:hypothetical protein
MPDLVVRYFLNLSFNSEIGNNADAKNLHS